MMHKLRRPFARLEYLLTKHQRPAKLAEALKAYRGMSAESRQAFIDAARAKQPKGVTSAFQPRK